MGALGHQKHGDRESMGHDMAHLMYVLRSTEYTSVNMARELWASFTLHDPPRFPQTPGARCPKDLGSAFYY